MPSSSRDYTIEGKVKNYLERLHDRADRLVGVERKEAVKRDVVQEGIVHIDLFFTNLAIEGFNQLSVPNLVRQAN